MQFLSIPPQELYAFLECSSMPFLSILHKHHDIACLGYYSMRFLSVTAHKSGYCVICMTYYCTRSITAHEVLLHTNQDIVSIFLSNTQEMQVFRARVSWALLNAFLDYYCTSITTLRVLSVTQCASWVVHMKRTRSLRIPRVVSWSMLHTHHDIACL